MATLIQAQEVINGGVLRSGPTNVRFDAQLIGPHIQDAEDRFLVSLLGDGLLDALKAEKGTTVSNYNSMVGPIVPAFGVTAAYEALWTRWLLRYASLGVIHEATPFIAIQLTANGLIVPEVQYGQSAGVKNSQYIQDELMRKMNMIQGKISAYLCDNRADLIGFDLECPDDDCVSGSDIDTDLGIIFY